MILKGKITKIHKDIHLTIKSITKMSKEFEKWPEKVALQILII